MDISVKMRKIKYVLHKIMVPLACKEYTFGTFVPLAFQRLTLSTVVSLVDFFTAELFKIHLKLWELAYICRGPVFATFTYFSVLKTELANRFLVQF